MKKKILFVFRHEFEDKWEDGLYAALKVLSYDYFITTHNLMNGTPILSDYDFILGWGAFGSPVDRYLQTVRGTKGLCIAGVAHPPVNMNIYDVLFYETDWYKPVIRTHRNTVHAFGVNTDIYKPIKLKKFFDYITVGAFSLWKRQNLLANKSGKKIAIGEIQKGNPQESLGIIAKLLAHGVMVSDMLPPKELAKLYNMSEILYMPSDVFGGGERAVLEARACGCKVEIEPDNPKLFELVNSPVWDHHYYAAKLREGIQSCLLQ